MFSYVKKIFFSSSDEQSDPVAQFNLDLMYANGDGVTKDYAEEVKWYRKSAEQGDHMFYWSMLSSWVQAKFQYKLGEIYQEGGYGVAQDIAQAKEYYQKALELNPDH